jgi:hypothetical protein
VAPIPKRKGGNRMVGGLKEGKSIKSIREKGPFWRGEKGPFGRSKTAHFRGGEGGEGGGWRVSKQYIVS